MDRNIIESYIKENIEGVYQLIRELCLIPAPSHHEEKRAEFCKRWLTENGADGVYTDAAKNTVFPYFCEGCDTISVVCAHLDTVFPDTEPMPYLDDGEKLHAPGVGDDTASLAVMLYSAKFMIENKIKPKHGILFVANSCEEGLGNLKGTRQIFSDYAGRIREFVTFDSGLDSICDACVGSHRYEVTVRTEGGHSFTKFGNNNAIHRLSEMISRIYEIEVPKIDGSVTTYNVGTVSGGTSVNTIAEDAKMLCEYRSSDERCLAIMKEKYEKIFAEANKGTVRVEVTRVGDRPCAKADLDMEKQHSLRDRCARVIESVIGKAPIFRSASTDCNIPLSLGIPAVSVGVYRGALSHTRDEWVEKASLTPGLMAGIGFVMMLSEQ